MDGKDSQLWSHTAHLKKKSSYVCAVRACAHAVALVEARGQLFKSQFPFLPCLEVGSPLLVSTTPPHTPDKLTPDLLSSPPTSL